MQMIACMILGRQFFRERTSQSPRADKIMVSDPRALRVVARCELWHSSRQRELWPTHSAANCSLRSACRASGHENANTNCQRIDAECHQRSLSNAECVQKMYTL